MLTQIKKNKHHSTVHKRNNIHIESKSPQSYNLYTSSSMERYATPRIDIKEKDKELIILADLPGINKDDIKITLAENILEIMAEKINDLENDESYITLERSYRAFFRSIILPVEVIPSASSATYNSGILEIRIPKAE
ncbi:MAG: Hsp20/alpha crystallin family protein [Nanoarchaeota archaeon]|nr:Hsp20/alpha crystallin family protein [Nanoarchaeota archaeon]